MAGVNMLFTWEEQIIVQEDFYLLLAILKREKNPKHLVGR